MSRPNSFDLGKFLDKDKLKTNGSNFPAWHRSLRILLIPQKLSPVLTEALGDAPADDAVAAVKTAYQQRADEYSLIQSGMLYAMEPDLQKRFESMPANDIVADLQTVFAPQARAEAYEASEAFFTAKMEEHSSLSEHVVKMSGCVQRLEALDLKIPATLAVDRVLQSLPPSYKSFVLNYNMQGMSKTLNELFAMLKHAEVEVKKEHNVLMVNKSVSHKKSGKKDKDKSRQPRKQWKKEGKQVADRAPKQPKVRAGVECYYCKREGHWKRNCPRYLEDKRLGKVVPKEKGI